MSKSPFKMTDEEVAEEWPEPQPVEVPATMLMPVKCPQCARVLPQTEEFWHLNKHGKVNKGKMCILCAKKAGGGSETGKKNALRKATQEFLKKAKQDRLNVPHIAEICVGMVRKFGSVEAFCNEWHEQIQAAPDGSKVRLDQYYSIFKMSAAASDEADRQVEAMSDLDLHAEQLSLLNAMMPKLEEMREDNVFDDPATEPTPA